VQDCPLFTIMLLMPLVTAVWKSTSGSRMLADLPPSSWATRFTVAAAACATRIPARVEPVNDIMSMSGCEDIASPTTEPEPLIML
jgi:hypothetical protein